MGPRWRLSSWSNNTQEPVLRLHQVSFTYHPGVDSAQMALRDVNLTVRRGEFVAVVGANGSGKSTLAKHLNAFLIPTQGQVIVAGMDTREPANLWEIRRRVGHVFQDPDNQLVASTVEEDVAFGPENLGLSREEIADRVEGALEAVGMTGFRTRPPHRLSGGQKQRTAIAGVLAMRPDVIVMDEATAMLDPAGRRQVLDVARDLNRRFGITFVFITHFMEEVMAADRVVVLLAGRVVADAPPNEVFRQRQLLAQAGLELPPLIHLVNALRDRGIDVPDRINTVEDLVEALCALRSMR